MAMNTKKIREIFQTVRRTKRQPALLDAEIWRLIDTARSQGLSVIETGQNGEIQLWDEQGDYGVLLFRREALWPGHKSGWGIMVPLDLGLKNETLCDVLIAILTRQPDIIKCGNKRR